MHSRGDDMERGIPERVATGGEARNVVMRQKKSRWRFVAAGIFAALVGLIVWDGADRKAADATRPIMMSPNVAIERSRPQTLKVASFNIHGGKGTDGVRNVSRIAELLTDVDVSGLYEVRASSGENTPNQAAAIANANKLSWLFAPSERRWWTDHFGNGLTYRIPVRSAIRIPLVNTRGKAYRNAILATAEMQGVDVRIIAVHIDREQDRLAQLESVIELFLGLQPPCVLMGDLNTTMSDSMIDKLINTSGVRSPLHDNTEQVLPEGNIDWIFTRGLRTVSARLVDNRASDHPVLRAELAPLD